MDKYVWYITKPGYRKPISFKKKQLKIIKYEKSVLQLYYI